MMEQDTSKAEIENVDKSLDSQGSDGGSGGSGEMKSNNKHDKKGKNDRRKSTQNGRSKDKVTNGVVDGEDDKSLCDSEKNGENSLSAALSKRNITLKMLMTAGILKPGDGTVSLEYHGQKFKGDLLDNGHIRSQETSKVFSTPSGWAMACKQMINPEKMLRTKSGCGWAAIKYRNLKLDYYKTVWFKRLREGSIDLKAISSSSSNDDEDDDIPCYCVVKFGEHFENNPVYQSAQQMGAKVLITCSPFKEIDRLQPFHVKISTEALALADFHCNVTNIETVGYISGHWNGEQNCLKLEVAHPCRLLLPTSTTIDCDTERNKIAVDIQRLKHEVVGWYHSHPRAPPQPSIDDISRQLDYQIMMKGASESSYVPCVGLVISPFCYSNDENTKISSIQCFWVMPPPDSHPMDIGRPMYMEFDTFSQTNFDSKSLLLKMESIINFYKEKNEVLDVNDLSGVKLVRLKETLSMWLPELRNNDEFWNELKILFGTGLVPENDVEPETDCNNDEGENSANDVPPISSTPLSLSESSSASPSVSSSMTAATLSSEYNNVVTSPLEPEASVASTPNPMDSITESVENSNAEPMEQD